MDNYSFERFIQEKKKNKTKRIIRLIISFIIISAISYLFINFGFFKDNNIAYYGFMLILATVVAYFNGYFNKEKNNLDGYFDGRIIFSKNEITIVKDTYPIDKIERITIHNNDYVGKKEKDFGEFDSHETSHGVNNQLILDLGNKHFVEVDFKQYSLNEFEKLKHILIHYHKNDKLSFDDLVYILKLEYDIDKNELRKQINKRN